MQISVITPTKDRPEALALCRRWVEHQDYPGSIEHIVIEGGGIFENLEEALGRVSGDWLFVFEDDTWYPPNWISFCLRHAKAHDVQVCGQKPTPMYHVPSGGYCFATAPQEFCPLNATSFGRSMLPTFRAVVAQRTLNKAGKPSIDRPFWTKIEGAVGNYIGTMLVVDLKGLPGAPGYTAKHRAGYYKTFDEDRSILKTLLGDDATLYLDACRCLA